MDVRESKYLPHIQRIYMMHYTMDPVQQYSLIRDNIKR